MMRCHVCGCTDMLEHKVLWPELVRAWLLTPHQEHYIDRQQGLTCTRCGNNLRTMALAHAIESESLFAGWCQSRLAQALDVLEINTAGGLTHQLATLPRRVLVQYPETRMEALPFPEGSFDLVVHSDTLEHVPDAIAGMRECYRVLRPEARCVFTVPTIVHRQTRSRAGLPASFHGNPSNPGDCLVHWEFGSDTWEFAIEAGFASCEAHVLEWPAAIAWVARKAGV